MFGTVVDTAIGLVLVFLLFSILLTVLMEIVSSLLGLRAKALENAIIKLIEDPKTTKSVLGAAGGMFGASKAALPAHRANVAAASGIAAPALPYTKVYNHPMVAGISGANKPSYVPGSNFASALVQVLITLGGGTGFASVAAAVAALPAGNLRTALETLLGEAAGDLDRLRAGVEHWYDSAMDRLTGGYKRFTQILTFVFGLGLAVAFNVDTVAIGQTLYVEPTLRAKMAAVAQLEVKAAAPAKPGAALSQQFPAFTKAEKDLEDTQLIGWRGGLGEFSLLVGLGWLITALTGLLGAPFWFDTLKGLVNIRGAGPKPDSSTTTTK